MSRLLFNIPLTRWIRGTIEKMKGSGRFDIQTWSNYWFDTYKELGGESDDSGKKDCPQHAAYGLWRLGRIKDTNIPYQLMAINHINKEYGKNAAYAILALELLEAGQSEGTHAGLWRQVQELFKRRVHQEPAQSQQGVVSVAKILFEEDQIVFNQE